MHNVITVIFPSHVTHIVQPFDVSIAACLKAEFNKGMLLANRNTDTLPATSQTNKLRAATVVSFIDVIDKTIAHGKSEAVFRDTGLIPFCLDPLRNNPYVLPGRKKQQQTNQHAVSEKILPDELEFQELLINSVLNRGPVDPSVSRLDPTELQTLVQGAELIHGRMLGSLHPRCNSDATLTLY